MIRIEVADPASRQAFYERPGDLSLQERGQMALLAHLGLWNCADIARAYGVTRHSVYRAKRHFRVVDE